MYRNTNYKKKIQVTEMQITEVQKYKLQDYRNTNYRITEIQVEQKFIHNSKVTHTSKVTYNSYPILDTRISVRSSVRRHARASPPEF